MVDRLFRPTAREPRSVRSPGTGGGEGGRGKSVSIWLENGNRCRGKRRASRCVAIALINSTARRTDRHRRIRLRKSYRIRIICTAMGLPVIARPVPLLFSYSPLLRELLLLPLPLPPPPRYISIIPRDLDSRRFSEAKRSSRRRLVRVGEGGGGGGRKVVVVVV